MPAESLSIAEARRIAIAAVGVAKPRPPRPNANHIRRIIRALGLLQLDYVNVLVPAPYMVLYSRLGPYDRALFDRVVYGGREFTEQWAHEASVVPVEVWPLLHHRREKHHMRPWGVEVFRRRYPGYIETVLGHIRERGPLSAPEIAEPEGAPRTIEGAWVRTVPRAVLEGEFGLGTLAVVARRPDLARVFDLAERVIPQEHHSRFVSHEDAQRELVAIAGRALGIGTAADLADYFRMRVPEVRPRIADLVEAGILRPVQVSGWREVAYLHRDARLPRRVSAATLLSPFDPLIWFRPRTLRLFDLDYRIEIFVPREQRKWGYYVLPFLLGDRIAARVDLKADRAASRLVVLAAYLEPGRDSEEVARALAAELRTLARWLQLTPISVESRKQFACVLSRALRQGI